MAIATEGGGGKERGGKGRGITLVRGRSCRKKAPGTERSNTEAEAAGGDMGASQWGLKHTRKKQNKMNE